MNILSLISNIEVRAMVADNPTAANHARNAYRHAGDYLRAIGAGDIQFAKGRRAVAFRSMRRAVELIGGVK